MHTRTLAVAGASLSLAGILALTAPLAASAHVRVDPDQAQPGSYSVLTVRVPNESATAGTVGVTVSLPQDTPFTSVSYQPVPGWHATVTTAPLPKPVTIEGTTVTTAPAAVTWTADAGTQIGPGQFQQFAITVGPVPNTASVLLPTTQAYSDGSTVSWDQKPDANGGEPEHPAPVLYITAQPPADGHSASPVVTSTPAPAASAADPSAATATALAVALAGLLFGAAGLVVAVFALTRMRAARPRVPDEAKQ